MIKNLGWAVSVCNRAAGRRAAWEAPPPLALVKEAEALLKDQGLWHYVEAKLAGGHPLPRMAANGDPAAFEKLFRGMSMHDVDGWFEGVTSGKSVNAETMTDAFIQRAGGEPGVVLASHLQIGTPVVWAEARVRVVQTVTGQPVIPRGLMRGEGAAVEIVGGTGRCHQETISRSGWRVVGGWKVPGGPNRIPVRPAGATVQKASIGLPTQKPKV
jgi:hypothetical protein